MMTAPQEKKFALEYGLASLLERGTNIASAVIGVGLVAEFVTDLVSQPGPHSPIAMRIVTLGIGLLILLPVLRLMLMLVAYLRQRDYRIGLITAWVLAVIFLGLLLGLGLSHSALPE